MVMPVQKPGKSKQDYQTPEKFLTAVKARLGITDFDIDLAADASNTACPVFYDEQTNSLLQPWKVGTGWDWLNPPYGNISPWVERCWVQSQLYGVKVANLVPASPGANWWKNWVYGKAYITFLNGRITFVGASDPYPKDLALLLYAPYLKGGDCIWSWGNGKD